MMYEENYKLKLDPRKHYLLSLSVETCFDQSLDHLSGYPNNWVNSFNSINKVQPLKQNSVDSLTPVQLMDRCALQWFKIQTEEEIKDSMASSNAFVKTLNQNFSQVETSRKLLLN